MTVSYINLMKAQQKRASVDPVVAFTSADELIASQKRARDRLMGAPGGAEPSSMPKSRPYRPFRKRDVMDVRSPVPPTDKADLFDSILPQSHWRQICREVCEKHQIPLVDLLSARRARHSVVARQEAMFRMRNETNLTFPQIGERLGGRDHTTVLYGVRKHAERMGSARE